MIFSLLIAWLPSVTVFFALALQEMALPFPAWSVFRPDLVVICLFYWRMYRPDHCGPIVAFGAGILLDLVSATQMGLNAFSKILLVLLVGYFGQRLRSADFVYLLPVIFVLVFLDESIQLAWMTLLQRPHCRWELFLGRPLATALVAPLVVLLLLQIHRFWLEDL